MAGHCGTAMCEIHRHSHLFLYVQSLVKQMDKRNSPPIQQMHREKV